MIKKLYRILLPKRIKNFLAIYNDDPEWKRLRLEILNHYKNIQPNEIDSEISGMIKFLRTNYLGVFPYKWRYKYDWKNVSVFSDDETGLPYVYFGNKKLYFKRSWSVEQVQKAYNFLQMEQDQKSPHRYLNKEFQVHEGGVIADVGVAEGNFALDTVEYVSELHLFEADEAWIEALEATFKPWKEKVFIVNKFVSDKDGVAEVSLDQYFENRKDPDFLKIDAEGSENNILNGAEGILTRKADLKIGLCTYHRQEDAEIFSRLLEDKDFAVSFSDGYMIFMYDKNIAPPYFRKGLIRATKNESLIL